MEPIRRGTPPGPEANEAEVEKLAMLHCTQSEIAAWFGITLKALESRFQRNKSLREAYDRGIGKGKTSLRRHQWKMVEDGSATMAIWLGKQILGQRDKSSLEVGPATAISTDENLKALSTQELQEYYRLRRKMESAGAGSNTTAVVAGKPAREVVLDVTKLQ